MYIEQVLAEERWLIMIEFNFEEWASLAKNYPEEFERKRKELLEQEIAKAPPTYRTGLRVLQMECDAYHNDMEPLDAVGKITEMMSDKLEELKDGVIELILEATLPDGVDKR
jgi:hypothetical protein